MVVAGVGVQPYRVPLVRPWVDASRTLTERRGALVRVTSEDGAVGWGDCAPLPGRTEGLATALAVLAEAGAKLCGRPIDPTLADAIPRSCPAARCAVETALLDLNSRHQGRPLAIHLSAAADVTAVVVNAALGTLTENVAERARKAWDDGFEVAKLKVGVTDWREEASLLRQLIAEAPPLRFRLDANRAWTEAEAASFLAAVADLPVEAVEEPLALPDYDAFGRLQAGIPFPLALDESLVLGPDDILASRIVRRLVLKPVALGGPLATLAVARRAKAVGIEVVVTSSLDTAIGVTAAAHLAAALGDAPAHGLATLDWLDGDVAPRPVLSKGRLLLPAGGGLGLVPFHQLA